MKILTFITEILAITLAICSNALASETREDQTELGYYQNLSSMYFVYTSAYFDSADEEKEKNGAYRDFVMASFVYWLNTRAGDLQVSAKVDKAIQAIWDSQFRSYENDKAYLKDPLDWADPEKQVSHGISGFRDMTKSEYEKYLKEYHNFLDGESE